MLLRWSPEPFARTTYNPGHVTCTGCVMSPDLQQVLLVHHRRLERWLLPGGHVESTDASARDTARREVMEETGVQTTGDAPVLVGLDVHAIPSNAREPLHLHHDLIWGFFGVSQDARCSHESRAVMWCGLDQFERYDLPGSIRRAVLRLAAQRFG